MAKARGKISKKLEPETNFQEVFRNWLKVTHDFEEWRHQLNEVIAACDASIPNGTYMGEQLAVANLRLLYQELMEGMIILSGEVSQMDERGVFTLEQIVEHTKIIRQWSKKIQYTLSVNALGAA